MSRNIPLHPTEGVNPRLSFCPRCGGESRDLFLVGANDSVWTCSACSAVVYGEPRSPRRCPSCDSSAGGTTRRLERDEKLPGGLCLDCELELENHASHVGSGGVYFRCSSCKASGVVKKATDGRRGLAEAVRELHGLEEPDESGEYPPCGIEFDGPDNCPACGEGGSDAS